MHNYKVVMALYANKRYPHWIVREEVAHLINLKHIPKGNIKLVAWQFTHYTEGGNSCFPVEFKIRSVSKRAAKKLAYDVTNTACINQSYIRGIEKIPASKREINIKITAEHVRGTSIWEVVLNGLLDTYEYNNAAKLQAYFHKQKKHYETPTLVSSSLEYIPSSWKRWNIKARIAAKTRQEAADKVLVYFSDPIWNYLLVSSAMEYSPANPFNYESEHIHHSIRKGPEMNLFELQVDVTVDCSRQELDNRAREILDECNAVVSWNKAFTTARLDGDLDTRYFIKYRASSFGHAESEIGRALRNELPVTGYKTILTKGYGPRTPEALCKRAEGLELDMLLEICNDISDLGFNKADWTKRSLLCVMNWVLTGVVGDRENIEALRKAVAQVTPCEEGWVYGLDSGAMLRVEEVLNAKDGNLFYLEIVCSMLSGDCSYGLTFPDYTRFFEYLHNAGIQSVEYVPKPKGGW